ncbi:hypothetical protein OUZ56_001263 [Daphnia magna]|uniref:Uncharacterized protein n=1 Tax=Daphnia magna TaxID=35525 RepID=A0ABR0A244_9CRUS|nr:hypothetical protein OUZ56_001263 [Daphnia magna]
MPGERFADIYFFHCLPMPTNNNIFLTFFLGVEQDENQPNPFHSTSEKLVIQIRLYLQETNALEIQRNYSVYVCTAGQGDGGDAIQFFLNPQ